MQPPGRGGGGSYPSKGYIKIEKNIAKLVCNPVICPMVCIYKNKNDRKAKSLVCMDCRVSARSM